jgi:hypothetical protein
MSLGLVKKNSSSPFQLQRSIVDQGGSGAYGVKGGAYESGGFNPDTVYDGTSAASAIIGMGKTVGASLASRTSGDINKSNIKRKSKLEERKKNLDKNTEKNSKKIKRVEDRITKKTNSIKEYEERTKPSLEADIDDITKK